MLPFFWLHGEDEAALRHYVHVIYEVNCKAFCVESCRTRVFAGKDGRYYLYYCLGGYSRPISVAVCDTPDGKYEYLGCMWYADGTPYLRYVPFDPVVMNDDGVIRLYYGSMYPFEDMRTPENT